EAESEQSLDVLAVDRAGPCPVEVGHGAEATDAGVTQAAFDGAAAALVVLALDDDLEQLLGSPPALGGLGDEVVEVGGEVVQLQRGQGGAEISSHRTPSWPGR